MPSKFLSWENNRQIFKAPGWSDLNERIIRKSATFDTAGSYTFTVPANYVGDTLRVRVTGGGGGGGGGNSGVSYPGGGGGGGGVATKLISGLSPGDTVSVTVGAGGAVGATAVTGGATGTRGITGGTSSFGSHCSATGGLGAAHVSYAAGGGVGVGGDTNSSLGPGGVGSAISGLANPYLLGGSGGGPGGKSGWATAPFNMTAPNGPGGGGAGAMYQADNNTFYPGSSGADGEVFCEWWEYSSAVP